MSEELKVTTNELQVKVAEIVSNAEAMIIDNQQTYEYGAEYLKNVKKASKQVKDFWEPSRVAAKKAYDTILAQKKSMTDPLDKAESIIKEKMGSYQLEVERQARLKEMELRRLAAIESQKKIDEAIALEEAGDSFGADFAMAEAENLDLMALNGGFGIADKAKADGISNQKAWKIKSIDSAQVPVNFGGMEIRPVDESAVMRLIKASKGTIKIPGIEYEETFIVKVRA